MRINNNLQAANASRQLNVNSGSAAKSMEKLSSGYRINRAGDDAAGLAISEKMRAQIRGLNQASKNSQEGISLIQTAEAGLGETHSILQRMRELAVQASTGTLEDDDRQQINKEFTALADEVDKISETIQFNKMTLLNGKLGAKDSGTAEIVTGVTISSIDGIKLDTTYTITDTATEFSISDGTISVDLGAAIGGGAKTIDIKEFGIKIQLDSTFVAESLDGMTIFADAADGDKILLQTGANQGETLNLSIADMSLSGLNLTGVNTNSADAAANAIRSVEDAIKLVSDERAKLGATQNRLEYKIKNLNSSSENLQSAESSIRDVDMASEMVEYTKNDILQQAAQAMLAKANQAPQNILQLLR